MVCPSILTVKSTIPSIIVIDGTSIILITLRRSIAREQSGFKRVVCDYIALGAPGHLKTPKSRTRINTKSSRLTPRHPKIRKSLSRLLNFG